MDKLMTLVLRLRASAKKMEWLALLVARITVGLEFAVSGWGKVHNLEKVTGFFGELGIPAPGFNAVLASFTELISGALLLVGLGSRLASFPLIVTMLVAIVTAKKDEVHGVSDLVGLVEWTYIALLVVIAVYGPGAASLDARVMKSLEAKAKKPTTQS
jgi:putative oxidoreductase